MCADKVRDAVSAKVPLDLSCFSVCFVGKCFGHFRATNLFSPAPLQLVWAHLSEVGIAAQMGVRDEALNLIICESVRTK